MTSDFSRTLALLRKEKKISQRTAASDLQISQALLSHYENGLREPGLSFVVRAADYYGVSCDFMLGRSMSREGSAMPQDKIPDASVEKDNVLSGSAVVMLKKKMLVNSTALVMDLVGKTGSIQLANEISDYLSLSLYRVFRYMYHADPSNPEETFRISRERYELLCDAQQKMEELRIRNLVENVPMSEEEEAEDVRMPELAPSSLGVQHPGVSQSLLTLLQSVSDQLSRRCQEKNKKY